MTPTFAHVVVTRFNAQVGYGSTHRRLHPDWLEERFRLFETFCYPSVCAQTVSSRWLGFFDADTPEPFRSRIADFDRLTPVFVDGRLTDGRIAESVAAQLPHGATHLITTRLDNDDALGDDYLRLVREAAAETRKTEFVNFPFGYEWENGRLYNRIATSNTFISLVEPSPRSGQLPLTVHCAPHDQLRSVAPVRQVIARPSWLVVIHGGNAANERLGLRRLRRGVPTAFRRHGRLRLVDDSVPARGLGLFRSLAPLLDLTFRRCERALTGSPARATTTRS